MPMLNQMLESKYLKQIDVEPPKLVTIKNIYKQLIGEKEKWIIAFNEFTKPLASGITTNLKTLARIFNSENSNDWIGKQVVLYWNPEVEYGGDITGGVRIRAVKDSYKQKIPQQPAQPSQPINSGIENLSSPHHNAIKNIADMEDDISF